MENELRNRKIPTTSPYGNFVFAYLSRLYAMFCVLMGSTVCQWEKDSIIVNNNVTIEPPYDEAHISGNENGLKEVKEWVGSALRSFTP